MPTNKIGSVDDTEEKKQEENNIIGEQ